MHLYVESARLRTKPLQVADVVGGVGDGEETLRLDAVGEEVIQHAPVLAAEHAVLRPTHGDLGDVVGEQSLQQRLGVGAGGLDLAHVRDVEDPALPAHRKVLLAHAGVLHGHLPTREVNELRAGGDVPVEQGGVAQGAGWHGAQVSGPPARLSARTAGRRSPRRRSQARSARARRYGGRGPRRGRSARGAHLSGAHPPGGRSRCRSP